MRSHDAINITIKPGFYMGKWNCSDHENILWLCKTMLNPPRKTLGSHL